jgi:hypothetical protein
MRRYFTKIGDADKSRALPLVGSMSSEVSAITTRPAIIETTQPHAEFTGWVIDEAASLAGISDMTPTTWRRDPEFIGKIKNAVSTRLAMRLSKIESGADGWQGTAWLLERLYPSRFSRPEVQISLQNTFNQTTNASHAADHLNKPV